MNLKGIKQAATEAANHVLGWVKKSDANNQFRTEAYERIENLSAEELYKELFDFINTRDQEDGGS